MSYNGLEIDMVSLGDADSLLVTKWSDDKPSRILIDAGDHSDTPKVVAHLEELNVKQLDHVICSHSDKDHAGGMVEFIVNTDIRIDSFWMHLPWEHIDIREVRASLEKSVMKTVIASLDTAKALYDAAIDRGLDPKEPFMGATIGFLEVLGPEKVFYSERLNDYRDAEKLTTMFRNKYAEAFNPADIIVNERNMKVATAAVKLGQPPTDSENETSTVLRTRFDGKSVLFTGDAGVRALSNVREAFPDVAGCKWMQIPHHGSSRNVTDELIAFFAPELAFVSAVGNEKHPRQEVVDAFKSMETKVYSTHYPVPRNLRQPFGNVPPREDRIPAVPL